MLTFFVFILLFIVFIAVIEGLLHFMIRHLRKDFQWLITSQDKLPNFNASALEKFFAHGFDPELGWTRKPNTQAEETTGTLYETDKHYKKSAYHINDRGGRLNPGHEDLPVMISTYGDSFVFSRQVNNNETWQWFLSKLTQSNVLNFGVGNYGIDQALLRLKREFRTHKTPVVILGVVPETIVRILSVWKHYSEYGNTFGFKPRFEINNGQLSLVRNIMDSKDKFYHVHEHLHHFQKYDYFYANKFKKDILTFPYLISLSKSAQRNLPLIAALFEKKYGAVLGKRKTDNNRPWEMVLERNFEMVRNLYQDSDATGLFIKILEDYAMFGKKQQFKPVFLIMPYLQDLIYIKEHGSFYENFVSQTRQILHTIDLTSPLMQAGSLNNYYSSDFYGGHFTKAGNELIASIIADEVKELLPSERIASQASPINR